MSKRNFRLVLGAVAGMLAGGLAVPAVQAADDPIVQRKAIMKDVGAAAKIAGGMLKGDVAFDADKAKLIGATWHSAAMAFGHYFPAGSDQGDTTAMPKVWETMDDFNGKLASFATDAAAIGAAEGEDGVKAAIGKAFENCKGCHEAYRKPQ
ncbi:MAG: cytochrome c [Hyphomicrobiaceae bacterium]